MTAQRYDTVLVHEPGIAPWQGSVRAIKPPVPVSKAGKQLDQWAEVRREDGIEVMVPLSYLEVLEPFVPRVSAQEREEAVGIGGALEVT